ncbi:MAG TPA: M24 family metallopeptidase [Polyangiaceae bacterium]|nr:M24 family metallopeptidase [Polyangiaceae bacterium]
MRAAYVAGIANAQRVARDAILTVAETVRPGDTEREACARVEHELGRAGVRHWLHTPYAWWGERTRFDWDGMWETNALPSERRLEAGESFILDVAPIVGGFPADFAYTGLAGSGGSPSETAPHAELLDALADVKAKLVGWAAPGSSAAAVCEEVEAALTNGGIDVLHTRYPANVLAHTLEGFPNWTSRAPRIGTGFQLPLLLTYATGLVLHHLAGTPYPFLRAGAPGRARGLYAVEPHIGKGRHGAKFESVLLIDGDETRWLDPALFGEVHG